MHKQRLSDKLEPTRWARSCNAGPSAVSTSPLPIAQVPPTGDRDWVSQTLSHLGTCYQPAISLLTQVHALSPLLRARHAQRAAQTQHDLGQLLKGSGAAERLRGGQHPRATAADGRGSAGGIGDGGGECGVVGRGGGVGGRRGGGEGEGGYGVQAGGAKQVITSLTAHMEINARH